MAAEVSRQIKSELKPGLITRDFLGGCFAIESNELDLDLHVPSGWEKRLDLKSGKVFIQRCNPTKSAIERSNFIPQSSSSSASKPSLNLFEDTSLDLKLVPKCSPSSYTSVCTLEKVKSALDRAERTSTLSSSSSSSSSKRRWMVSSSLRSPTKSSSSMSNSSSIKQGDDEDERLSSSDQNGLIVTACQNCLLYVLISKSDPKCPQCNSVVQSPRVTKKPKIDLNMSI